MEFKKLTDSITIPVIGLGTWTIGGGDVADTTYDSEDISAMKTAIKLGITHIDIAEAYAGGHTEELVGRAIGGFDRKSLFVTSKVSPEHLSYDDLLASAKGSLRRLNTDYLDLYLIHAPNPDIPIQETMKAMDSLVEQKLIRYMGVSNFSVEQIKMTEIPIGSVGVVISYVGKEGKDQARYEKGQNGQLGHSNPLICTAPL